MPGKEAQFCHCGTPKSKYCFFRNMWTEGRFLPFCQQSSTRFRQSRDIRLSMVLGHICMCRGDGAAQLTDSKSTLAAGFRAGRCRRCSLVLFLISEFRLNSDTTHDICDIEEVPSPARSLRQALN